MRRLFLLPLLLLACTGKTSETPKKNANGDGAKPKGPSLSATLSAKPIKSEPTKLTCSTLYDRVGRCLIPSHENVYNIPVKGAAAKGASHPLVTIVEFSDMECPGCAYWALTIFPKILKKYPKEVKLVFKHFPLSFHPLAPLAAQAMEEVRAQKGNAAFWKVHDFFYTNRDAVKFDLIMLVSSKKKAPSADFTLYKKLLGTLGIDLKQYKKALVAETHKKKVEADVAFGNTINVNQTPQVFINGRLLPNSVKPEVMVAQELARAKKLVASGVARARIYDHIVSKGSPVLKIPRPKKEVEASIAKLKPLFIERCKTAPKLQPLVKVMKKCTRSHKTCHAFRECVNTKLNQK